MKTMMTIAMMTLALTLATTATAQQREAPNQWSSDLFYETADTGALCPKCQVLMLDGTTAPVLSPYTNELVDGGVQKAPSDVLVYDAQTGATILVRTRVPRAYGSYIPMFECVEQTYLRPNMFWATGDLDGDGRGDLIGHDKTTGEVYRLFQRGATTGCQP